MDGTEGWAGATTAAAGLPAGRVALPRLTGLVPAPRPPVNAGANRPDDMFGRFAELTPEPLLIVAATSAGDAVIRWANLAVAELLGYDAAELVGQPLALLGHSRYAQGGTDGRRPGCQDLLRRNRVTTRLATLEHKNGMSCPVKVTAVPVDDAGEPRWVVTLRERAFEAAAGELLRASEERFRALADRAPIAIFQSGGGLRLTYVNDGFCRLFDRPAEGLLGTAWLRLVDDGTGAHSGGIHRPPGGRSPADSVVAALQTVLDGASTELPVRVHRPDGTVRWAQARVVPVLDADHGSAFVGTLEDVTDRRAYEAELTYQAEHDTLTGLPNRVQLWRHLREAVDGAHRPDAAVLFFDLDDFKTVNDSLGHNAGDLLLVEVARRLSAAVRDADLVTRFGGDEFVVLVTGVRTDEQAGALAERLLHAVCGPALVAGVEVTVSASVGVVRTEGRTDAQALLRDADVAMYQAKDAGRNGWALFDQEVRGQVRERLLLVNDLRRAIDAGEIDVVYQPVVTLADGRITAVEALARWTSPTHGAVPPSRFIPLAEEAHLVAPLGELVLDRACAQLADWRRRLGAAAPARVAVNVSASQLPDPTLIAVVTDTLARHGLRPADLCLEITESVFVTEPDASLAHLHRLRALGVELALDDFGTGYSSLSYLNRLPVAVIKMDRSFVSTLDTGSDAIVRAVVALADALHLDTVAEGVETEEQARRLLSLGCRAAQGFHLCRPSAASDLDGLFARHGPQGEGR